MNCKHKKVIKIESYYEGGFGIVDYEKDDNIKEYEAEWCKECGSFRFGINNKWIRPIMSWIPTTEDYRICQDPKKDVAEFSICKNILEDV